MIWFGHVSRSSGLARTILQGTVQRPNGHLDYGIGAGAGAGA